MDNVKVGNLLIEEEMMRLSNTYLMQDNEAKHSREMVIYKTTSLGGCDGRMLCDRYFESLEFALEDALKDVWNDNFRVSRLRINFDGSIKVDEYGDAIKITCLRDLWMKDRFKWNYVPEFDKSSFPTIKLVNEKVLNKSL